MVYIVKNKFYKINEVINFKLFIRALIIEKKESSSNFLYKFFNVLPQYKNVQ